MKPPPEQLASRTCAVCCDLAADATVRVALEAVCELRRRPGPVYGEPLPASFLKHADEQTIVGLTAVYQAIDRAGWQTTRFDDWGVIAAPRFLGRHAMAAALQRFQAEGAWGVSPHLIPHRSLHSVSGSVSQALKIHGPNFGVGGGPGGAVEAMLTATAMLEGMKLPGVWVVLTCLDPEVPLDEAGCPNARTECVGLALALTPIQFNRSRIRLRVVSGTPAPRSFGTKGTESAASGFDVPRLEALLGLLRGPRDGDTRIVQLLDACGRIELARLGEPAGFERGRPALPGGVAVPSERGSCVLVDS